MTEQLQDQLLAGELDGAIGFVPSRVAGAHLHARRTTSRCRSGCTASIRSPTASQLELADLEGVRVTLVGGGRAERSGYNAAVRELFAAAGVRPEFVGTDELFPARAGASTATTSASAAAHDFPPEVVARAARCRRARCRSSSSQRAGGSRAAVRAFAPFAAAHLADVMR